VARWDGCTMNELDEFVQQQQHQQLAVVDERACSLLRRR